MPTTLSIMCVREGINMVGESEGQLAQSRVKKMNRMITDICCEMI